jgi:alcohol dehydrogenase class IV
MSPDVVILDPELASLTPDWVWLSTGVRAIDHCVETLCSLQADEEAEKTSLEGLGKLVKGLLITRHGATGQEGLNARLESMHGARMAMAAIRRIPMGGSHAIGHQLGTYGVPHGYTSCVICPYVMRYNKSVNEEKQKKALEVIWESNEKVKDCLEGRGLRRESADLYDVLDAIFREFGMPRKLKDVDVEGEEKLQELAEKTLTDRWAKTNPIPLERTEQVMEILKMAAY